MKHNVLRILPARKPGVTFVSWFSPKLLKDTFSCVRWMRNSKLRAEQSRVSRTLWTFFSASLKVVRLPALRLLGHRRLSQTSPL